MNNLNTQIEELKQEVENHSFYGGVGDEPDDEKQQRLFILDTLKTELKKRESELAITTKLNDQRLETAAPSLKKIDDLTTEIEIDKERIDSRRKDRVRLAGIYFDLEETLSDIAHDMLTDEVLQLEHEMTTTRGYLAACKAYLENEDEICDSIVNETCSFDDCEAYGIPYHTPRYVIFERSSVLSPRIVPTAKEVMRKQIFARSHALQISIDVFESSLEQIREEQENVKAYKEKRPLYEVSFY